jgi:hypothetical protein
MTLSPLWGQWLKCDPDDLLGHGWTNFVHRDDQHLTRTAVDVLQANQSPRPYRRVRIGNAGSRQTVARFT